MCRHLQHAQAATCFEMLHDLGAKDVQFAFDRACLQSQIATARRLFELGGRPGPGAVMGPCETLSESGLAFLLELGADLESLDINPLFVGHEGVVAVDGLISPAANGGTH